jgi:hypothetical protein
MAREENDRNLNRLVDRRLTSSTGQDGRAVAGRGLSKSALNLDSATGNVASIYFSKSKSDLSADSIAIVRAVFQAYEPLLSRQNISFTFTGYASARGSRAIQSQNKLALERAETVEKALRSMAGGSPNYTSLVRSSVDRRADIGQDRADIVAPPIKGPSSILQPQTSSATKPMSDPCLAKDVTKIPVIMDRLNFTQGARLMRKWLGTPAGNGLLIDDSTITMDFVLRFDRAKQWHRDIILKKSWFRPGRTAELLTREGFNRPGAKFDFTRMKPIDLKPGLNQKSFEVSYVQCGGALDPPDGLKAALGVFSLMIVVGGQVDNDQEVNGLRVTITKVGVFVADKFDFEDSLVDKIRGTAAAYGTSQPLGVWNACRNTVKNELDVATNEASGDHAYTNRDFRDFRDRTGRGRDLWVLSDVKVTTFDPRNASSSSFVIPR